MEESKKSLETKRKGSFEVSSTYNGEYRDASRTFLIPDALHKREIELIKNINDAYHHLGPAYENVHQCMQEEAHLCTLHQNELKYIKKLSIEKLYDKLSIEKLYEMHGHFLNLAKKYQSANQIWCQRLDDWENIKNDARHLVAHEDFANIENDINSLKDDLKHIEISNTILNIKEVIRNFEAKAIFDYDQVNKIKEYNRINKFSILKEQKEQLKPIKDDIYRVIKHVLRKAISDYDPQKEPLDDAYYQEEAFLLVKSVPNTLKKMQSNLKFELERVESLIKQIDHIEQVFSYHKNDESQNALKKILKKLIGKDFDNIQKWKEDIGLKLSSQKRDIETTIQTASSLLKIIEKDSGGILPIKPSSLRELCRPEQIEQTLADLQHLNHWAKSTANRKKQDSLYWLKHLVLKQAYCAGRISPVRYKVSDRSNRQDLITLGYTGKYKYYEFHIHKDTANEFISTAVLEDLKLKNCNMGSNEVKFGRELFKSEKILIPLKKILIRLKVDNIDYIDPDMGEDEETALPGGMNPSVLKELFKTPEQTKQTLEALQHIDYCIKNDIPYSEDYDALYQVWDVGLKAAYEMEVLRPVSYTRSFEDPRNWHTINFVASKNEYSDYKFCLLFNVARIFIAEDILEDLEENTKKVLDNASSQITTVSDDNVTKRQLDNHTASINLGPTNESQYLSQEKEDESETHSNETEDKILEAHLDRLKRSLELLGVKDVDKYFCSFSNYESDESDDYEIYGISDYYDNS